MKTRDNTGNFTYCGEVVMRHRQGHDGLKERV